jgi:hypothetical protein
LSPKGEFWNHLERALDLSKNVSEPAKNDLGNNPSMIEIPNQIRMGFLLLQIIEEAGSFFKQTLHG